MRLVSINIERSKHLDRVLPFLEKVKPDVTCVQELHESDTGLFEDVLGRCVINAPNCWHIADVPDAVPQIMETAIFTKLPVSYVSAPYYAGSRASALTSPEKEYIEDHSLLICDLVHGDNLFRVMTTHFTWSYQGMATDLQRKNMLQLRRWLAQSEEFVLTGDFNAPRRNSDGTPGEIFAELSSRYKDNVPLQYQTSLDLDLHRAAKERGKELANKMVDGLFTTPKYVASNVELVFGVSDHAAIVADISKA